MRDVAGGPSGMSELSSPAALWARVCCFCFSAQALSLPGVTQQSREVLTVPLHTATSKKTAVRMAGAAMRCPASDVPQCLCLLSQARRRLGLLRRASAGRRAFGTLCCVCLDVTPLGCHGA